jgi:hypothetical protein
MRSSFALLAAGSLAITALGRLVDFESAPEANITSGGNLTVEPLGGNPDVVVWDLQSYANYEPDGDYSAYALGTTSCNQGDVPLLWQSNTNLHPVIGQNMYRWKDGRFEQIGMGWLKHGFFALSLGLRTMPRDRWHHTRYQLFGPLHRQPQRLSRRPRP